MGFACVFFCFVHRCLSTADWYSDSFFI
jgi:hypothetical protein